MADSIFTKIIKGEIPCHKVYEDETVLAFLTIMPRQPGHTLVIPKKQIDHLWDVPDKDYSHLMAVTKKVAQKIKQVTGKGRVGVLVVGEEVPHAHIHLVPFDDPKEFFTQPHQVPEAELAEMAAKLTF